MESTPFVADVLSTNVTWLTGFEVGVIYVLMAQKTPLICGNYRRTNEEQLFLMAGQFGYTFKWQPISDEFSVIMFTHRDLELMDDEDDDGDEQSTS